MATDKEIIQQLVKIAKKQQLAIAKLAQVAAPAPSAPPPQALAPSKPVLNKVQALIQSLPPALKPGGKIVQEVRVMEGTNEVHVRFQAGQDSDANFKSVMAAVQAALPGMTVKQV